MCSSDLKFLLEKAQDCWNSLDLQAFEEILALLIYGLVLFPNTNSFVDVNVLVEDFDDTVRNEAIWMFRWNKAECYSSEW